jgi:hypothetical protein
VTAQISEILTDEKEQVLTETEQIQRKGKRCASSLGFDPGTGTVGIEPIAGLSGLASSSDLKQERGQQKHPQAPGRGRYRTSAAGVLGRHDIGREHDLNYWMQTSEIAGEKVVALTLVLVQDGTTRRRRSRGRGSRGER